MQEFAGKHVLIIIENLPAPFDRRVWQQACSLKNHGAEVSIICPKMKNYTASFEEINGIKIYRHPLIIEAQGPLGYLIEYSMSLFWELVLSFKIFFKKRFHIIHGCNPPDLIFLVSLPFKLFGVKFIFDHHDVNPELYIAKFNRKDFFYKLMLLLEKLTFKTASYSIATNESYKQIAITRGGMDPEKVQIVRSGPNMSKLKLQKGNIEHKKNKRFLIGYVGVIGEQEGLDLLLQAAKIIKAQRNDIHYAIIGTGTELDNIRRMADEMDLNNEFTFWGHVNDETLLDVLNTCDICVNPDKPTEMNDISTMNKIMEYMALKKPIVQFDLKEGRFSAGDASLYAKDVSDFAHKILILLEDEAERNAMGETGYNRVKNELCWEIEEKKLLSFYKNIFTKG